MSLDLRSYFPAESFGEILSAEPASFGLSGASVTFVETSKGDFVLRVINDPDLPLCSLAMRLASEHSLGPPLLVADDERRFTITERIKGSPIASVLGDPGQRGMAIASIVSFLRNLHSVPTEGLDLSTKDPLRVCLRLFAEQSVGNGFPAWALPLRERLVEDEAVISADPRRCWSHNDFNPTNILWDGSRVWLVDWQDSGLTHPYYDLAVLTTFLTVPDEAALGLLTGQEGERITDEQVETFWSLRRVATILMASTFLSLVPDAGLLPAMELEEAPSLTECYGLMASGELNLQGSYGQRLFGLALFRQAVDFARH